MDVRVLGGFEVDGLARRQLGSRKARTAAQGAGLSARTTSRCRRADRASVVRRRSRAEPLEVAYHARQGGDIELAASAYARAAAQAAERYDHVESERLLNMAVGCLTLGPQTETSSHAPVARRLPRRRGRCVARRRSGRWRASVGGFWLGCLLPSRLRSRSAPPPVRSSQ